MAGATPLSIGLSSLPKTFGPPRSEMSSYVILSFLDKPVICFALLCALRLSELSSESRAGMSIG
jgi:hypothetical protein